MPSKPLEPTYYVRHPDDSFTVASPQPSAIEAECGAQLAKANARTVMEFSEDEVPTFSQGLSDMELLEVVTAERCTALIQIITELRAQLAEAKAVPVKYKRLEFNAQLQQQVKELEARLAVAKPDIATMVNRFLGWKLPQNFNPDAGISFVPSTHPLSWPIGTNLLTADQAKAMIEYLLGGEDGKI